MRPKGSKKNLKSKPGLTKGSQLRVGSYYLVAGEWVIYISSKNVQEGSAIARSWTGTQEDQDDYEPGDTYLLVDYKGWIDVQHPVLITRRQAKVLIHLWTPR